jgi:hypothetical protein
MILSLLYVLVDFLDFFNDFLDKNKIEENNNNAK